tara:strand:- start:1975 stop:2334 length:360 start_codon:yes stop_codon:yes gene_type:complete
MRRNLLLLPLLLMVACATPRVTTPEERALANTALSTVESILVIGMIKDKVTPQEAQFARAQIAGFREMVTSSISHPLHWTDVYHQILNLGVQWAAIQRRLEAVDMPPDAGGSAPVDDRL